MHCKTLYKLFFFVVSASRIQRVSCPNAVLTTLGSISNSNRKRNREAKSVRQSDSINQRGKFSDTSLIRPTTPHTPVRIDYRYTPTSWQNDKRARTSERACIAYFTNCFNIGGYNIFHRVYSTLHRVQCALRQRNCRLFLVCGNATNMYTKTKTTRTMYSRYPVCLCETLSMCFNFPEKSFSTRIHVRCSLYLRCFFLSLCFFVITFLSTSQFLVLFLRYILFSPFLHRVECDGIAHITYTLTLIW